MARAKTNPGILQWFRILVSSCGLLCLLCGLLLVSCRKEAVPPSPDDTDLFSGCITPGTPEQLELVTFNAGGFPKEGYTSITALAALVKTLDPDVIALQEVKSEADFNRLVKLLPGWIGMFNPVNNDEWNLAYLIKSKEAAFVEGSENLLFSNEGTAFPRAPYEIKIKYLLSGKEVFLINLHLKCCGGEENENSRRSASLKLKQYLDNSRANDRVVMLGDFNDEISSDRDAENPFLNFVNDPARYQFADMQVARGSVLWWSYPSYPSHIDHILVTNEAVPSIDTCLVIKAAPCYPDYSVTLSDHRPVELILTNM